MYWHFVIVYLFMSPWTEGRPVVKLHQNTIVHLFVLWAYSLINARNMNHANWNRYFPYVNTGCSTYINLLDLSLCMDSNIRNKVTWLHTTPSQIRIKFCKWPTGRTILLFCNTFITVLHMFRKTSCSSSGGQFLLIQHLVSSLSVSVRPVCRSSTDAHLQRVTIPDAVLIQIDFLMMRTTLFETCRGL